MESSTVLNITNGDSARKGMLRSGFRGDILCWRDVLHEGPVPTTELSDLSPIRAAFIAAQNWGVTEQVKADFHQRDQALRRFRDYFRLVLWFEHDLYDQLQLIQILHWLAERDFGDTLVEMVCVDDYLGSMNVKQMTSLDRLRQPVSDIQLRTAARAWQAFCSDEPKRWEALLRSDTACFPFLKDAIVRQLEQYPDIKTGLSRTEKQVLQAVTAGCTRPFAIFDYVQEADGIRFMGDSPFWRHLAGMCEGELSLLRTLDATGYFLPTTYPVAGEFNRQDLALTTVGRDVLDGRRDWLTIKPVDRWCGGTKLSPSNVWRWDGCERNLVRDR